MPLAQILLRAYVGLALASCIMTSVAGMKLRRDHIEVLRLQTNVTFLKVKVKVKVWNFKSQFEHR